MGSVIDKASGRAWHKGVRVTKVPESGAKRKLLDAAVSLVARAGFDSVSVRDVTGASGTNVAAVNYHYGSREGLMGVVIASVLEPLCARRAVFLEGAGKSPSAESLIRAYVAALLETAQEIAMEQQIFLSLAGRILALPNAAMPPTLAAARHDISTRYLAAISSPSSKVKASDWEFFEAGLAQSLIAGSGSENIAALLEDWSAFGLRALAPTASVKKKKDDAQGFLFDF